MICIGEIVNVHGIKGEIKVRSSFAKKEKVFQSNNYIYIGAAKQPVKIVGHRKHQQYDLLLLDGHNDINEVLHHKGEFIYATRESIVTDEFLVVDLLGFQVIYDNKIVGLVTGYFHNNAQDILVVEGNNEKHFIPYVKNWVNKIIDNKIYLEKIEGLIDEN